MHWSCSHYQLVAVHMLQYFTYCIVHYRLVYAHILHIEQHGAKQICCVQQKDEIKKYEENG